MSEREMYSLAYHFLRCMMRERAIHERPYQLHQFYNGFIRTIEQHMFQVCPPSAIAAAPTSMRLHSKSFQGRVW